MSEMSSFVHKKICKSKDSCGIVMSSVDTNILELNQYQKSNQRASIIYADLESIEKVDCCKNDPEKSQVNISHYYVFFDVYNTFI